MKVMQVSFDTSKITIIMEDNDSLIDILNDVEDSFIYNGNDVYYKFDDDTTEICVVDDVTNKRGIIQFESH